jgi:hypothetical protein
MSAKFGDPDWFSAENLAARASAAVDAEDRAWTAYGQVMANIIGSAGTEPGPPYTHTIRPPEVWYSRSGKVVYRPPMAPAFTLTTGEIRPPGPRTEIMADFCQCPACRAERCEP